jgi:hypothetical protein
MLLDAPGPAVPDPGPGIPGGEPLVRLPSWYRAIARFARVAGPATVVAVSLPGVLVTPPWVMASLAPLIGLFAAGAVLTAAPAGPVPLRARRTAVVMGVGGVLAVPLASGLGLLGGVGLALGAVLVVLGTFVLGDCLAGSSAAARVDELTRLLELFPSLPTGHLLRAWRVTEEALQDGSAGPDRARAVQVRAVLLEELTRRDPGGVARWIRSGGGSPEDFIRADLSG